MIVTPPTGKEEDWAVLAEKAVAVYGNGNASTWQIESNRILIDYGS
ncbi:hypothetical protein ACFPN2_26345 [Steroidobacter flavus]|uniref:Uncharacterized protein n=1 Tax=Steroidobacter flavus TaxID=1842136 RepID=A0ABV8SZW8_9GAMM